jgi:hypothetical protein
MHLKIIIQIFINYDYLIDPDDDQCTFAAYQKDMQKLSKKIINQIILIKIKNIFFIIYLCYILTKNLLINKF